MPIPSFQDFMLPLLKLLGDGVPHRLSDLGRPMAEVLRLTEDDLSETLESGKQTRFENRLGWAKTYLGKAGLVETPRRGYALITPLGLKTLDDLPDRIDIAFLRRFSGFEDFRLQARRGIGDVEVPVAEPLADENPEEVLDTAYRQLRAALLSDLLAEMKTMPPGQFERLVLELLGRMGYGLPTDLKHLGRSGDEGIDGMINQDKLGLDAVYVQAKRWQGVVGRPIVQEFTGSLEGQRATKGVLLTTSHFSAEAHDYVSKISKKVVLIDGKRLAELMVETKLGVSLVTTYEVLKVDRDYFAGELASAAE